MPYFPQWGTVPAARFFCGVVFQCFPSMLKLVMIRTFSFRSFFSRFFSFRRSLLLLRFPSRSLCLSFLRCEWPSSESDELETSRLLFSLLTRSLDLERDLERRLGFLSLDLLRDLEEDLEACLRCLLRSGLLSGDLERDRRCRECAALLLSGWLGSGLRSSTVCSWRRLGDLERDLESCCLSLGIIV